MQFKNLVYYVYKVGNFMYKKKIPIFPFIVKVFIRIIFCSVIPPQAKIGRNVLFGYNGLGIVIHPRAIIGNNCIISQNVSIGGRGGNSVPRIGNNVLLGAGCKILGNIRIGNDAKIGANSVVLKDIPDGATAVGIPARVIKK